METVEERINKLETVLGQFIVQSNSALLRLERAIEEDRKGWNRKWGDLANKMVTIVEDIVAPNIPRIAKEYFSCNELEDFMIRRTIRNKMDRTKSREFDVIAVCGDKVLVNETKASVRVEYVDGFIDVLKQIHDYLPEFRGKDIIPIFASLYIPENIINYLSKNRIYAMALGDETMTILNVAEIAPV